MLFLQGLCLMMVQLYVLHFSLNFVVQNYPQFVFKMQAANSITMEVIL